MYRNSFISAAGYLWYFFL